jgi:hypothetical protein
MCPLLSLSVETHHRAILIASSYGLFGRVMHQTHINRSPLLLFVHLNLSCCDPSISSANFNHVNAAITSSDAPLGISLLLDT